MSARTLILGGGFGGIATAVELRRLLGDDHEILLVDRKPQFAMGLRKLWELVGHGSIADGSRSRALLARHGVEFLQMEINAIDPSGRRAETADGWLKGDHLVVALGAVSRPDLVPGLAEHGHDVWDFAGVPAAAEALRASTAGGSSSSSQALPTRAHRRRTSAPSTSTSTFSPAACGTGRRSRLRRSSRC